MPRRGKRIRVLLAEDEPGIRFTFSAILQEQGYEVEAAQTYEEAHERVRGRNFDAVIADLNLEREGLGLVLAREAKGLASAPAVVIYTGYPTEEQLRAALALRVDYLAIKPVDLEEIKAALRRLIARRGMGEPAPV